MYIVEALVLRPVSVMHSMVVFAVLPGRNAPIRISEVSKRMR